MPTTSSHAAQAGSRPRARILGDLAWAHTFILFYSLAVACLALAMGRPQNLPGAIYLPQWTMLPFVAAFVHVAASFAISRKAADPPADFRARLDAMRAPGAIAGLAIYISLGFFHGSFTAMKGLMPEIVPFHADPALADLDELLHGADPWTLIPQVDRFTRIIQVLYLPIWVALLAAVSFWVCLFADKALRARYLKTFFFAWVVLGNVLALVFMSAGPVYYEHVTGSDRFGPILHYLEFSRGLRYSNLEVVDDLWENYTVGNTQMGSGISAFPSLHLSMATLWVCTCWRAAPRLRAVSIVYLVLIQIGSVYLGWHYAIDGYVSIIATLAAWFAFGRRRHEA